MAEEKKHEILYAVMKLNTTVEAINQANGEPVSVKLNVCAGYIPVFDTMEETEEAASGTYGILPIQTSYINPENESDDDSKD